MSLTKMRWSMQSSWYRAHVSASAKSIAGGDKCSPLLVEHGGHQLAKGGGLDVALLPQLVQIVPELQLLVPALSLSRITLPAWLQHYSCCKLSIRYIEGQMRCTCRI